MTSGWPAEASSIPVGAGTASWATVAQRGGWHRLPLPQAPSGGTDGQAAHSLSPPHPCPGLAAPSLPGAPEGTIFQSGPNAADSGRLLVELGQGGWSSRTHRGPNSSPPIAPPLGAEEMLCRSRSDGRNTWACFSPTNAQGESKGHGQQRRASASSELLPSPYVAPMGHPGPQLCQAVPSASSKYSIAPTPDLSPSL